VPAPTVVIDTPASDRSAALEPTMVEACTNAIAEGRCALASQTSDADQAEARAVAIVSWADGEQRTARIEVGLRRADRGQWLARTIEFRPQDAQPERWRAVGLVIATLVGDAIHAEAAPVPPPAPAPSPAPPPPPPPPIRAAPEPVTHDRAWVDAGALIGPGLDTGAPRFGAGIRAAWAPLRPPLFVTVAAAYAGSARASTTGVGASWTTLAAGVGPVVSAAGNALRFDARFEAVAERFDASVVAPDTGATDDGSLWRGGARVGLEGAWMPGRLVGVVAGAEGSLLDRSTTVRLHGVPVGQAAPHGLEFAGFLSVRAVLP
jgi:hypothetical protein